MNIHIFLSMRKETAHATSYQLRCMSSANTALALQINIYSYYYTGNGVLPVTSQYTGPVDCLCSILRDEGMTGLFKGFGALLMQYMIQVRRNL